ncbi:MAG: cytochrome c oxidase subunit II [Tepidisphaeraceae bacterium]
MTSLLTSFPGLLAESNGAGLFLPQSASTVAPQVDALMWFINAVAIFFTILIFVLTIVFTVKYHHKKHPEAERTGHNNALELTWTAIPTVIVFIMFFWGFFVYMDMNAPASESTANAYTVNVEGYTWGWRFKYRNPENGVEVTIPFQGKAKAGFEPGLYLQVGVPVQLVLKSDDVIHSLFMPAFRVKKDVVPGRYNKLSVTPTVEGTYDIYCTEYCGDGHSRMLSKVHVVSKAKMDEAVRAWGDFIHNEKGELLPPEEIGLAFAGMQGCFSCHADQGKKVGVGPAWTDVPKHMAAVAPGMSIEDYVHESIVNPSAKIAPGFGNQMQAFRLTDEQIGWLIAYIKSLNGQTGGSPAPAAGGTTAPASH